MTRDKKATREKKQAQYLDDFLKNKRLNIENCLGNKSVSFQDLPCNCHVQGLGWAAESKQVVLTCQDKCDQKNGAYLLLYDENKNEPNDVKRANIAPAFNHPSSIQITQEIFPVAFAAERYKDSFIDFYAIKDKQLKLVPESRIHIKNRHIGALAYATIDNNSYLLGVGWDAEDLMIWKADSKNATTGYRLHLYAEDAKSIIKRPNKKKWGPYNSLWLGQLSDDQVVLMGTHGHSSERKSYLDIWQIIKIDGATPILKLLYSKRFKKTTLSGENFFYEGVTIKTNGNELKEISIIAAPHDFTTNNCPEGFRCSENIYEINTH